MLYRRVDRFLIQINDPVALVGSVNPDDLIEFDLIGQIANQRVEDRELEDYQALKMESRKMTLRKHVSLNINVRGVEPSATLAINERCKILKSQGQCLYNLGLGQSPFPVPTPVVNALRLYASEKDYLPVKGVFRP